MTSQDKSSKYVMDLILEVINLEEMSLSKMFIKNVMEDFNRQ